MIVRTGFRRTLILLLLLASFCLRLYGTHQKAAELIVEHVSGYTYKAKLYTYTFTQTDVDRPQLEIGWGDGTTTILTRSREVTLDNDTKLNYYEGTHTYAGPGTYTLYMEDPNRNSGVVNVPNSVLTYMYISTTITISPWLGEGNSSPVTTRSPVDDMACLGRRYEHNPAAYDPDGDSLSYHLIPCRGEGGESIPGYTYPAASDTFMIDPYTGTLVWDAPMAQGEYNAAILIEEWRNKIKIGDVTRDMQIIVRACENLPPSIECDESYCVTAGQTLMFPVWVLDRGRNRLKLEVSGEVMQGGVRAGLQTVYSGEDSAFYFFYWNTSLSDSRDKEYMLYLRAEDDGDPALSSVKIVRVKVMAPPSVFEEPRIEEDGFYLTWTASVSPHAASYELYRRDCYRKEPVYDSCQVGIGDDTYRLVADLPLDQPYYFDSDVLEGREYCYRLLTRFPDGDMSKQSDPVCLQLRNIHPLLTKVDVLSTDEVQGRMAVEWVAPEDLDTSREWTYSLYAGISPDSLFFEASFPFAERVIYQDSGLNTVRHRYFYRVAMDSVPGLQASSVYLKAEGLTHRIRLDWDLEHPWMNYRYDVYRYEDSVGGFCLIGSSESSFYDDTEVKVDKEYRYYVEAVGGYGSQAIPDTLYNRSNIAGAMAMEGLPCPPWLDLANSSCSPLSNTLVWDFDSLFLFSGIVDTAWSAAERDECEASVSYYEVFRKNAVDMDYEWLATVEDKEYVDNDPGSLFCWYYVVAVNESDMAGMPSNEVFADNWDCFSFELPDVFTPNGDSYNETWTAIDPLHIDHFHVKVVNRWGVTVFSSSDPEFSWNGKVNNTGADCPDGPYFYVAEFEVRAEGKTFKKVQSGSVSILR